MASSGQLSGAGIGTNGIANRARGAWPKVMAVIDTTLSEFDFTNAFHDACSAAANSTIRKVVRVKLPETQKMSSNWHKTAT